MASASWFWGRPNFGIIIAETIHELGVTDDKRVAFEISRSGVIAGVLMAPEQPPSALIDDLYYVDEMATQPGMDALLEAADAAKVELDLDDEPTPADVAVQVRLFGGDYRSNPEWFDRNLDQPSYLSRRSSLPNDLSITGTWGWASKPDDVLLGVKALAAWLTKRADAVLAGAVQNPDGSIMDYSRWPEEARAVVDLYRLGTQVTAV